ncbi:MAG: hypothetical protein NVSMB38_43150 [Ktedonobacteraceae bacterium]
MIQDQYHVHLDQTCITNPTVQQITDEFVKEMAEFGITGVVFDLTDIYPNAKPFANRTIQVTCFSTHCLKQLELNGWKERGRSFMGNEDISRFVLKETETGTMQIVPRYEWLAELDTNALLQFAKARDFVSEKDNALADAEKLLRYLAARGRVTAESMHRLVRIIKERGLNVAVVLSDEHFDMMQGTCVGFLEETKVADEYWLPDVSREFAIAKGLNTVLYLFGGATYGLNSFFELLDQAGDATIMRRGIEYFIDRLLSRTARLRSNQLNPGVVFALELTDDYSGFVGVPISQDDAVLFTKQLGESPLWTVLPKEVVDLIIDRFQNATKGIPGRTESSC